MINYDCGRYPYNSRRTVVMSREGMVATSQPLAARAGIKILDQGGNAVDAAVAAAACLTVVEPTSNGIGGDAFCILWVNGELHGLNASGYASRNITIEKVRERGHKEMPAHGWIPVTVPGVPAAWAGLVERFGNLPLAEDLRPAVKYAGEGFPVSPTVANNWQQAFKRYKNILKGKEYGELFRVFAPEGNPPEIGEIWSSQDHARTLALIGESRAASFYRGKLAEKIIRFSSQHGGFIDSKDLGEYKPEWVTPLSTCYQGYNIHEIPPNGQGLVVLMALNILKEFDGGEGNKAESYHKQIEALKLAFTDGKEHITDIEYMPAELDKLLSCKYARQRRDFIAHRAVEPVPEPLPDGDTVYLTAADGAGNMVSYIQSNYQGFGSGLVVPDTGIALQNRGKIFSLDRRQANHLRPRKKPYHTIIPGFITKGKRPVGSFGVMGGFMQPQGHLQVLIKLLRKGINPQAALDAPRWRWMGGRKILVEKDFPVYLREELEQRGHRVNVTTGVNLFGRGQIIIKTPAGVLQGATEKRCDGSIAVR